MTDFNTETKKLTKDIICQQLSERFASTKYLWFPFLSGVLFLIPGILCIVFDAESGAIGAFLGLSALFFFLALAIMVSSRGWKKPNNYYILKDACVKKHIQTDEDDCKYYYLTFQKSGKQNIGVQSGLNIICSTYSATDVGDECYLVFINSQKKPTLMYPTKLWEINETEFTQKDGQPNVFIPTAL